jgi:hypothetical protein
VSVPLVLPDHDTDYDVYVVIPTRQGTPRFPINWILKLQQILSQLQIPH